MKKSLNYLILFFSISIILISCEKEVEISSIEKTPLLEILQSSFNANEYKKAIPYSFVINWSNPLMGFSEELETKYYEFPIIYTSNFNPNENQKGKFQKRKYNISYKLLVTESEEHEYKYYILKFYQENLKNISAIENNLLGNSNFTGYTHLLNNNGDIVFAKIFKKGIEDNKKFYNKEFKELSKKDKNFYAKIEEECTTVTIYHYTDNYIRWGNDPAIYVSTTYNGSTTETSCELYWLPDLEISGGGGGGEYSKTDDGGVYNNCVGSTCKYQINDVEITTVLDAPDSPIVDVTDFLKCFDTSKSAQLTIYVDQPIANQNDSWTKASGKAGHVFISLKQGSLTRSWGLYPEGDASPFNKSDPHAFGNNSQNEFDVSITTTINHASLLNIINDAENYNINYNLDSNNCTDYAIQAAGLVGINLPDPQSNWPNGSGSNPGAFGEAIRGMTLPSGMTRNITTGISAQHSSPSNCN